MGLGLLIISCFSKQGGDLYQVDLNEMKIINKYKFQFREDEYFAYLRIKNFGDKLYLIDNMFNNRVVQLIFNKDGIVDNAKLILGS